MNRENTLFHLREAAQELERTIRDFDSNSTYNEGEFVVAMGTAWNARDESDDRLAACSDDDFYRWRRFPEDIDLGAD